MVTVREREILPLCAIVVPRSIGRPPGRQRRRSPRESRSWSPASSRDERRGNSGSTSTASTSTDRSREGERGTARVLRFSLNRSSGGGDIYKLSENSYEHPPTCRVYNLSITPPIFTNFKKKTLKFYKKKLLINDAAIFN